METTINIHAGTLQNLRKTAGSLRISRSELIIRLMKKVMNDIGDNARTCTMVKYQARRYQGDWHTFHISIQPDEYEYLLDLRKLLKMSVSLILAYAVNKYLKKKDNSIITDKNLFINYFIIKEMTKGITCWKFFWGHPPAV